MSELPTQTIDLPLAGGLQEHVDRRLVPPGAFLKLENMEHAKAGSLVTRRGYGYLPNPDRPVRAVTTRGGELVAFADGTNASDAPAALSYHADEGSWTRPCDAWRIDYRRRPAVRSQRGASLGQRVVIGSRVVFVWVDGLTAGLLAYRVESTDGTLVIPDTSDPVFGPFAPGGRFVLTSTGNVAAVVYYPGSGNHLRIATIDPATGALVVSTLTGIPYVQGTARQPFDAKGVPTSPGAVLVATALAPTVTTQRLSVATVDAGSGFVVSSISCSSTGRDLSAIQIRFHSSGTRAAVAYRRRHDVANRDDVYLASFSGFAPGGFFNATPDFDAQVFGSSDNFESAVSLRSHLALVGQDTAANGWVVVATNGFATHARRVSISGGVFLSDLYVVASSFPVAEPFTLGGQVFCLLASVVSGLPGFVFGGGSNAAATAALVALSPGMDAHGNSGIDPDTRYVVASGLNESLSGTFVDQLGKTLGAETTRGIMVPSHNADGSVSLLATVFYAGVGADAATGLDEITYAADGTQFGSVDMALACATSGGLTARYDGQSWVETGFLHKPAAFTFSQSTTGGAMANGTYVYAFVYEWQDAAGDLHQSEPSLFGPFSLTGGTSTQKVDVTIKSLGLTQKRGVGIAVYRTKHNGSLLFRISPRTFDGSSQALLNNPRQSLLSFTDTLSDEQLGALGRGFLYTAGGQRPTVPPPPSRHMVRHQDRLWLISSDDPSELWFTKILAKGETPSFARGNQLRIDGLPSPPTALASQGERLVVFTASGIYYFVGQGPDDTGQSGAFSPAYEVPTTCGCSDPRSVLSTHLGVFFLGPAGLMLLDQGLSVSPIGAPVENQTAGRFCRRAVNDEPSRRAYWLFTDTPHGAPGSSRYVVFDYDSGAWYVWTISPQAAQRDQCVWRGEHVVCDGQPAQRGFGAVPASDPDGSYVAGTLQLPWVNLASVAGFQRLRNVLLTGTLLDACNVYVRLFVNHDSDNEAQFKTFALGGDSQVIGLPQVRLSVDVKRQLASQHLVEIVHEPVVGTTGTGPRYGIELAGVSLHLGVKKGAAKLAAQNRK